MKPRKPLEDKDLSKTQKKLGQARSLVDSIKTSSLTIQEKNKKASQVIQIGSQGLEESTLAIQEGESKDKKIREKLRNMKSDVERNIYFLKNAASVPIKENEKKEDYVSRRCGSLRSVLGPYFEAYEKAVTFFYEINSRYSLFLMSLSENEKLLTNETLQKISQRKGNVPILIKEKNNYSVFMEIDENSCIRVSLDKSIVEALKLPFTKSSDLKLLNYNSDYEELHEHFNSKVGNNKYIFKKLNEKGENDNLVLAYLYCENLLKLKIKSIIPKLTLEKITSLSEQVENNEQLKLPHDIHEKLYSILVKAEFNALLKKPSDISSSLPLIDEMTTGISLSSLDPDDADENQNPETVPLIVRKSTRRLTVDKKPSQQLDEKHSNPSSTSTDPYLAAILEAIKKLEDAFVTKTEGSKKFIKLLTELAEQNYKQPEQLHELLKSTINGPQAEPILGNHRSGWVTRAIATLLNLVLLITIIAPYKAYQRKGNIGFFDVMSTNRQHVANKIVEKAKNYKKKS